MKATTRHLAELLALSVICATLTPAVADEGRIPVFRATTITEPGSYVLTRDIVLDLCSQLVISASGVDLDLNGHTVRGSECGGLISVSGFDIVIRNGRLTGNVVSAIQAAGFSQLKLDHIRISGSDSGITGGAYVEMVDSSLTTIWSAVQNVSSGRFVGNHFRSGDIAVSGGMSNSVFEHNVFDCGIGAPGGLSILDGNSVKDNLFHGCLKAINVGRGNVVEGNLIRTGMYGVRAGDKNRLIKNVLEGVEDPIHILGDDNVIAENVLWGGSLLNTGIRIAGSFNLIDGNTSEKNTQYGIEFVSGTENLYRNNTLRNNQLGSVGGLVGDQVDGGGNYP
jgi:parallel beta-helix repeat protein